MQRLEDDIDKELARILREVQKTLLKSYYATVELPSVRREIGNKNEDFFFRNHASASKEVRRMVDDIAGRVDKLILSGVEKTWKKGTSGMEGVSKRAFTSTKKGSEALNILQQGATQSSRSKAAAAFYNAKREGFTISDRVWNLSRNATREMEVIIQNGIKEGLSADEIQKSIRGYLREPDKLFKRVRNARTGELELSKAAQEYKPGRGVYRSAYKNAMRLARTELKAANCEAVWQAMQTDPSITGYRVVLSNNHTHEVKGKKEPLKDICDELQGEYPKSFKFTGWHPQCYSSDTDVLTNSGWKRFKDVKDSDLIFSLNPKNKQPEWVPIVRKYQYHKKGDLIRFHNRGLDLLVTTDHKMIYLNKTDGRLMDNKNASAFVKTQGGLYRSSEYQYEDVNGIDLSPGYDLDTDAFIEFMAYYLSEGSLSWTREKQGQLKIAQKKSVHEVSYSEIERCLSKLPFVHTPVKDGFYIRNKSLYQYLKQFGKSVNKHVPLFIKNASPRQIRLFLDAYSICDGHSRQRRDRPFIGNRGTLFTPKSTERIFFTSSPQMAADIGELLVKIGKRPSYKLDKIKGVPQKHRNGIYEGNVDVWRISECHSKTSTVFEKSIVSYDDMVYDIELERNHILYVRRNGKCVWGSNCRCEMIPILATPDERKDYYDKIFDGNEKDWKPKQIENLPKNFTDWIEANKGRATGWKSLPRFMKDNYKNISGQMKGVEGMPKMKIRSQISTQMDIVLSKQQQNVLAVLPFTRKAIQKMYDLAETTKIQKALRAILNDAEMEPVSFLQTNGYLTKVHPNHKKGSLWRETLQMAESLNNYKSDVGFLPESTNQSSPDAIISFRGKLRLSDFKYSTSTKPNTIATDILKGFRQTGTDRIKGHVTIKVVKADFGQIHEAIQQIKRSKQTIGDLTFINKHGKVATITSGDIVHEKYKSKLKGFF